MIGGDRQEREGDILPVSLDKLVVKFIIYLEAVPSQGNSEIHCKYRSLFAKKKAKSNYW